MNKTFEIAKYEYTHHVGQKRFWIALLSVPLAIILMSVFSVVLSITSVNSDPVGIVDHAGLISVPETPPEKDGLFDVVIQFNEYPDEAAARAAAENGQIQGFFVVPENFEPRYQVEYFSNEIPGSVVNTQFLTLLSNGLLAGEQLPNAERLLEGSHITMRSLDGSVTSEANDWTRIVVPILIGVLFMILVMTSGGYLMQALVEEKENRTMEVMVTSVSPNELMAGKIIGNLAVGITTLLFWAVIAAIALVVFLPRLPILSILYIPPVNLVVGVVAMLLSFVSVAALMATLGATLTQAQEAQSVNGLVILPVLLPFYFMASFFSNPNGVIPRILTYMPLSSPLSLSLRMALTTVPAWEVALTLLLLLAFCVFSIWLAGKAFRLGMLQYTRRISLKELFSSGGVR